MCLPTEYKIMWEINPWMNINHQVNEDLSWEQWYTVYETLQSLNIQVYLIKPKKNFADMVFSANAGFCINNNFILSNFRYLERKPEENVYFEWFKNKGFNVYKLPEDIFFEGQGELLPVKEYLLLGYGFRSDLKSKQYLEEILNINKEIIPLKLVDERFYHLDTCLFYIDILDTIVYYPKAFDEESVNKINNLNSKKLEVSEAEALNFSLNSFSYKNKIILTDNQTLESKESRIESYGKSHGVEVIKLNMSEFLKSGGGVKCITFMFYDT